MAPLADARGPKPGAGSSYIWRAEARRHMLKLFHVGPGIGPGPWITPVFCDRN
jgi:hypothetical protein